MSETVCAVICNWNKQDDVVKCVDSVLKSSHLLLDVAVVDNASTDDSVKRLKERFGSKITVIENEENLGGAGGFNTGLHYAATSPRGYDSVWLLDNDVVVDPDCLKELVEELRKSAKNAIVGSLILRMDAPNTLQELGAFIDKTTFRRSPNMRDCAIDEIPAEAVKVDYVPACSLLVDMAKLKKVGLMDENFFIYFDDVEWCTRFANSGYNVLSSPRSKVWHKEGGRNKKNTLPVYYTWRNYLHFMLRYLTALDEVDSFIEKYITETFTALYITRLLGKDNAHQTILWAVMDAVRGKWGKAAANRFLPLDGLPLGRHFKKDFQKLTVIGADLYFYSFFELFLDAIHRDGLIVDYYTQSPEKTFSESIRQRVTVKPLDSLDQEKIDGEILVFCNHILSAPNPLEENLKELLDKLDKHVFYLDQFSNFFPGYRAMTEQRQKYRREMAHALKTYTPIFADLFFEKK